MAANKDQILKDLYDSITAQGAVDFEYLIHALVDKSSLSKEDLTELSKKRVFIPQQQESRNAQKKASKSTVNKVVLAQQQVIGANDDQTQKSVNDALIEKMAQDIKQKEDLELLLKIFHIAAVSDHPSIRQEELATFLQQEGSRIQGRIKEFRKKNKNAKQQQAVTPARSKNRPPISQKTAETVESRISTMYSTTHDGQPAKGTDESTFVQEMIKTLKHKL